MKGILFIIFLLLIIFILMIFGFDLFSWREKYTDYNCDIGKNETIGDFKVIPDNFFNNKQCVIKFISKFFFNFNKSLSDFLFSSFCFIIF